MDLEGTYRWKDRGMDIHLKNQSCVLQDNGPLGPLPKKEGGGDGSPYVKP